MKDTFFYKSIVRGSLFAAVAVSLATNSLAATVLNNVQIEGNKRIETSTIVNHSGLAAGENVDQNKLDEAVRKLFDSGYFSDVKIGLSGQTAVIKVVENPIVNRIYFEGNKEYDDATISKQIRLQPRQIYTVAKLKQDTKTLHDMYRVKGHFGAKVTPKIVRQDQNRVDVVFEVVEGGSTKVAQLIFIGNRHMKSDALKRVINTRETKWWRFFSTDDNYDPARLDLDQELLRRHYLENGYVDFQVKSAVAELTTDQKEFFITYTVDEGERYTFGKVDVDLQVPKIDVNALKSQIMFKDGDWYNTKTMDKSIKAMTEYLGSHGYAFVDIKPIVEQDSEKKTVSIKFEVLEGPKSYIDKIIITGNVRTNEDVIRRELLVYEGDAYNSYNIKRSKQRITNLGFFKSVELTERPAEASDKVDLLVKGEEEESTGEFWVAAGYSTAEGILGNVGIKENNFMGRGQSAHLSTSVSKKRQSINLGFMEPHFLNRNIHAGFDIFKEDSKQYFNSSFESKSLGLSLKMGYDLTEYLSQGWTYTIQNEQIGDIRKHASIFIRNQPKSAVSSSVTHRLQYDTRDDRFEPTAGYFLGTTNQFAGLGGNIKYVRNELSGAYFYSIADDWVLSLRADAGAMHGVGGKVVRIADRFTMGGDGSLRGFQESGAETRDKKTKDALGGLKYYLGQAELGIPLVTFGIPSDLGIKGHIFTDVGAAWDSKFSKKLVYDTSSPRLSVGFGISWRSPMGPLRIDFAQHLRSKNFDRHKTVHFGFFMGR
jgi:outer membrane protein insertion porin family